MAAPSPDQVLGVLAHIQDPDLGRDVVSLGMIKELEVSPEGRVSFTFELTTPACPVRDRFKSQAQDLVGDIPGVTAVDVRMTANVRPAFMRPKPSEILPGVKQTIAVASGKGGVGKSTVAVNLAAALRKAGADVGLLDADIYGPSVPAMIGSRAVPEQVNGRLQPVDAHGLKVMSFGLIYPAQRADDLPRADGRHLPRERRPRLDEDRDAGVGFPGRPDRPPHRRLRNGARDGEELAARRLRDHPERRAHPRRRRSRRPRAPHRLRRPPRAAQGPPRAARGVARDPAPHRREPPDHAAPTRCASGC